MKEKITGAEALIRALLAEGVDTVFGYPGGQIITVYDKLYDYADKLRHILVRHEQGAIHAAEGYARVSNRPGVVIVTSGPGVANVVTGLSDAQMDSTPVVVISGQVGAKYLGSDAFQETDVVGITLSVTKWSMQVRNAEDIPSAVAKAFYIATSGRPGPVVLDISRDAQVGTLNWEFEPLKFIRSYNPKPTIPPAQLLKAAALLNGAKRPMILAGHGVMISSAEKELIALAEKADIPVGTTLLGLSNIPSSHPLNKGMLGMHGNLGPNYMLNEADVILGVGLRFDDRITGDASHYANQAKVIHIDIDASELSRSIPAEVAIHGDAKEALTHLLPLIEEAKHTEWIAEFDKCNDDEIRLVKDKELHHEGVLTMGEVVDCVSKAAGDNAVLVTDVGQNQMMSARYFKYTMPKSIVTSGGLGTMGFGLPASIGAKLAAPERTVCFFSGDGGFQMTIQELGTIMQYGVNVKMVVLNNSYLGNVRQWQDLFYNKRFSQTPLSDPDFCMICSAYKIASEKVTRREDLAAAVDRMMAHDGSYLLNVVVDEKDNVFPMIPPGGRTDHIMINEKDFYTK